MILHYIGRMLPGLVEHCVAFRSAVDRLTDSPLKTPGEWRACLLENWVAACRLYLDLPLLHQQRQALYASALAVRSPARLKADIAGELAHMKRLRDRMTLSPVWQALDVEHTMAGLVGLNTVEDLINRLSRDLPEAAWSSLRDEACARTFLRTRSRSALAELEVNLGHTCGHHLQFALPALESAFATMESVEL